MNLNDCLSLSRMVAPELQDLAVGMNPESWETGTVEAYAQPCAGPRIAGLLGVDEHDPVIMFVAQPTAGTLLHELAHLLPVGGAETIAATEALERGELDLNQANPASEAI